MGLLCYSIGLAEFLRRQVETWPRNHRPAFVGTYEDLGLSWGAETGTREDSDFWEHQLPARMAELAAELPPGKRFDAFIVDEAQDFADNWWTPLLAAMKDEELGGLFIYSDENQRIFARFGQPPVPLVPLVLDHNLRNTRQIYESFGPLAPTRMSARGGEGPAVHFVPAATADAVEVADEAVGMLLDIGWFPGNIALMTTGKRHDAQVARDREARSSRLLEDVLGRTRTSSTATSSAARASSVRRSCSASTRAPPGTGPARSCTSACPGPPTS